MAYDKAGLILKPGAGLVLWMNKTASDLGLLS